MKILVTIVLGIILTNPAVSQHKTFSREHEIWLDGYAYLNSGEKVKGKINYNFVSETIRVKSNGQIRTHVAKNVSRFTVYDSIRIKSQYYSFPFSYKDDSGFSNFAGKTSLSIDQRKTKNAYHFFQVKYQNSKGAILSNLEIDYQTQTKNHMSYQATNTTGKLSRSERVLNRIYFLDKKASPILILQGKVEKSSTLYVNPFSDLSKYNHTNFDPDSDTSPNLEESSNFKTGIKYGLKNKDFLEELDPRNYRKLEAYIEKNGIDIRTIEGLTQLIDYWAEI